MVEKEIYTSFIIVQFSAANRDEMYERIWELEQILDENNYRIEETHTVKNNNIRSVRYGRN